jgi:predicted  nucleic acid-binding Zn-ribbon protein
LFENAELRILKLEKELEVFEKEETYHIQRIEKLKHDLDWFKKREEDLEVQINELRRHIRGCKFI